MNTTIKSKKANRLWVSFGILNKVARIELDMQDGHTLEESLAYHGWGIKQ